MTNIMFLDVAVRKTQLTFMPNPIAFIPDAHAFVNWIAFKECREEQTSSIKIGYSFSPPQDGPWCGAGEQGSK